MSAESQNKKKLNSQLTNNPRLLFAVGIQARYQLPSGLIPDAVPVPVRFSIATPVIAARSPRMPCPLITE